MRDRFATTEEYWVAFSFLRERFPYSDDVWLHRMIEVEAERYNVQLPAPAVLSYNRPAGIPSQQHSPASFTLVPT